MNCLNCSRALDQPDNQVDTYEEMRKILLSMGASEEKFPPRESPTKESTKEKTGRRSTTPETERYSSNHKASLISSNT